MNRGSGKVIKDGNDEAGSDGKTGASTAGGAGGGPEHAPVVANERANNQKLKRITFIPIHPTTEHQGLSVTIL